jgi:hypothetical protein
MRQVQIVWNPLHKPQHRLGTVTLHDQRDRGHVMGCPKCQGLPMSPDSPQQYTVPFWDAYDKENEKWQ